MNYFIFIKDKLANPIAISSLLLLTMVISYCVIMAEAHWQWKLPVICIGIFSWFVFRNSIKHPIIWLTLLTLLIIDLYYNYFRVANHHFMLVLVVIAVISYNYHQRSAILIKNIQLLLVVVIVTSVVQKLISPQFISGDFYYYMMNRGFLFKYFMDILPQSTEISNANAEMLSSLKTSDPNLGQTVIFKDVIPNLGLVSHVFAWTTIAMELLVATALLLKPKSNWTHLMLGLMIFGILCTRIETGFMGLLAICGLMLSKNRYLKWMYVTIISACILLVATRIGLH